MNRNKSIITVIVLLILSISLCIVTANRENNHVYPPKVVLESGEEFLFNPFNYSLGIYDYELMEWRAIDAQGAFFQSFDWGNLYPYYVVGDQKTNTFYAGSANESVLEFNFSLSNKGEALSPFATNGELFLYLIEQVNDEICTKRIVTISDDGKINLVANLDGMSVMSGIIVGDLLYFTCSISNTDLYEVWSLDLTKDIHEMIPVLIRNDYNTYRLYQYKEELLYIDLENKLLYNDNITIELSQSSDLVFLDNDFDVLVEEYVNEDNELEMLFTDISTGTILGKYVDTINFSLTDSRITIYGNGFLEYIDLSKGV